jgi:hypothetical protein
MSVTVVVKAYSDKNNPEFQKHLKAVKFCLENDLSFPRETSEFFQGKVDGGDLEDFKTECILEMVENGVEVPLKIIGTINEGIVINVGDISKEVSTIVVKYV